MAALSACQTAAKTVAMDQPSDVTKQQPDQSALEKPTEKEQDRALNQAHKTLKKGRTELALQQFLAIVETNPAAPKAYTNIGLLYLHKQDNKPAEQAFLKAIEQDKSDAIAYNHLAVIQRQEGLFKLALFNYYKAIDADPAYANAHLNLGILLDIYLQDLPKALQQYEKFQQLTNSSSEEVGKWIIDIKRRIEALKPDSQ